ncbi:hypothetical protein QBC43DRAFT_302896 [Cladorrhinum sp. PSN259]|nr:hypothetical protein QBC43DRAFT_302896 [Cladorrhinum sp. PSN259]
MMTSRILATNALLALRPRPVAFTQCISLRCYRPWRATKASELIEKRERAAAEERKLAKLAKRAHAASFRLAMVCPENEAPRLEFVPKDEDMTPPFELEVVRKFAGLKIGSSMADWNKVMDKVPAIKNIELLPHETIREIYYDTCDHRMLSRHLRVRTRNGKWEARIKLPGAKTTGDPDEEWQLFKTSKTIGTLVHQRAHIRSGARNPKMPDLIVWNAWERANWGLDELADFVTERSGWKVDCSIDRHALCSFHVYWEKTNFGYEMGKIKVIRSIKKKTQRDEWKKLEAAKAKKQIREFMKLLHQVFEVDEEKSRNDKLASYMEKYQVEPKTFKPPVELLPGRDFKMLRLNMPPVQQSQKPHQQQQQQQQEQQQEQQQTAEAPGDFIIRRVACGTRPPQQMEPLVPFEDVVVKPFEEVRWVPVEAPKITPLREIGFQPFSKEPPPPVVKPFDAEAAFARAFKNVVADPYVEQSKTKKQPARTRKSERNLSTEDEDGEDPFTPIAKRVHVKKPNRWEGRDSKSKRNRLTGDRNGQSRFTPMYKKVYEKKGSSWEGRGSMSGLRDWKAGGRKYR